jgi:hypothetical protein
MRRWLPQVTVGVAAVIALAACSNPVPSSEQAPSAVALEQVRASPD